LLLLFYKEVVRVFGLFSTDQYKLSGLRNFARTIRKPSLPIERLFFLSLIAEVDTRERARELREAIDSEVYPDRLQRELYARLDEIDLDSLPETDNWPVLCGGKISNASLAERVERRGVLREKIAKAGTVKEAKLLRKEAHDTEFRAELEARIDWLCLKELPEANIPGAVMSLYLASTCDSKAEVVTALKLYNLLR
jgi:hypothetical protein